MTDFDMSDYKNMNNPIQRRAGTLTLFELRKLMMDWASHVYTDKAGDAEFKFRLGVREAINKILEFTDPEYRP